MSYYSDRKKLLITIQNILKTSPSIELDRIYFYALETYGYGDGAVNKIIARLIKEGRAELSEDKTILKGL